MFYELLPRLLNWDVVRSLNYGQQKSKPAPWIQLKLDLAVLPKVIKYFSPIIPWFWRMEIGLMCVFELILWWKHVYSCPFPSEKKKKLLYMGYWDYWTGMLSLNWLLLKKRVKPFPLLLHLCFPIKLHWDYRPEVWMRCNSVVIESLCFNWTIYFI